MLRLLSIRNFVVVEALDLELAAGFSVLTGETGAGKSLLLDALGLLLGDRFELRQLRPGAEREPEGVEQDRLARAGLAGQHAEPRLELELELFDQHDIVDGELPQHRTRPGSLGLTPAERCLRQLPAGVAPCAA